MFASLPALTAVMLACWWSLALLWPALAGSWGEALTWYARYGIGLGAHSLSLGLVVWGVARLRGVAPALRRTSVVWAVGVALWGPVTVALLAPLPARALLGPWESWPWPAHVAGAFLQGAGWGLRQATGVAGGLVLALTGWGMWALLLPGRPPVAALLRIWHTGRRRLYRLATQQLALAATLARRRARRPLAPGPSTASGLADAPGPLALVRQALDATQPVPAPTLRDRPPMSLWAPATTLTAEAAGAAERQQADDVIRVLASFQIQAALQAIVVGPTVVQLRVTLAPGTKAGRVDALASDLAIALRAPALRVALLPADGVLAIEVPRVAPVTVRLRHLLEAPGWASARGTLPVALGIGVDGTPHYADLGALPHALVAGTTGSGKSVLLHGLLASLCVRFSPAELTLLLIDPKMVELSLYRALPHLGHPVVTDPQEAARVLQWAVQEMERRYKLLQLNHCRQWTEFNERLAAGRALMAPQAPTTEAVSPTRPYSEGPLPAIVCVIDELADLMMTNGPAVERALTLLAQKARAVGMHIVAATQRPSVDVVTGLLKANIPGRLACRVASKVDSRTILDSSGAEALLGQGDLLFLRPGAPEAIRMQAPYVSTEELDALVTWWADAVPAPTPRTLVLPTDEGADDGPGGQGGERVDALLPEAARICVQHQGGSTSLLQRRLRVGYGRAARLVDTLADLGILGPPEGAAKPRALTASITEIDAKLAALAGEA